MGEKKNSFSSSYLHPPRKPCNIVYSFISLSLSLSRIEFGRKKEERQ